MATAEVQAPVQDRLAEGLDPEARALVATLHRELDATRRDLLARREERQRELDAGGSLDFLEETREIREGHCPISPKPEAVADRRGEITGPTSRKMVINALNSGAKGFMADFE